MLRRARDSALGEDGSRDGGEGVEADDGRSKMRGQGIGGRGRTHVGCQ